MIKTLLTACLLIVFAAPGFARMPMDGPMEGPGPMMEMGPMDKMGEMMGACLDNADSIGLTEAQTAKLTPLHREMKKKQVRFKADAKIAEMELMEIMEVKDFDLDKAKAATRKIADLKTAYHLDMLTMMKEVRSALTDEQFKKLLTMKQMHRGMKLDRKKVQKKMDRKKRDRKMDDMKMEMK